MYDFQCFNVVWLREILSWWFRNENIWILILGSNMHGQTLGNSLNHRLCYRDSQGFFFFFNLNFCNRN